MTEQQDHILIVEDEPITRDQLVSYFEDEGFRVTSTGSGDEVLPLVTDSDVILVLLDIKLPGKDGLTLTREIRTQSDIGIILVTSKQEQIDRILGLESGAQESHPQLRRLAARSQQAGTDFPGWQSRHPLRR